MPTRRPSVTWQQLHPSISVMRYLVSLAAFSYVSYIATAISIAILLDNWLAAPAWLQQNFFTNDYLAHILTVRYQYSGTLDGWAGPDSGFEAVAIAASALAGWCASRFLPCQLRCRKRGSHSSEQRTLLAGWQSARSFRQGWRARYGLMLGLLIGALGALGGALIDKSIYDARERAYRSQWTQVTDAADTATWPIQPSSAHGVIGWLTPAEASIVLPGVFLASAASVLLPTWRVFRGSVFSRIPRRGRCHYRVPVSPGTGSTTCPECGHANPTLSEPRSASADPG